MIKKNYLNTEMNMSRNRFAAGYGRVVPDTGYPAKSNSGLSEINLRRKDAGEYKISADQHHRTRTGYISTE